MKRAFLFAGLLLLPLAAQAPQFKFKATTNLVLVNLTARDAHGNLITNLKPSDITLLEDGKPQHILSFDFENVDARTAPATADAANNRPLGEVTNGEADQREARGGAPPKGGASRFQNRRLMVLYFDLTTMQPDDVQNVMQQAEAFVNKQMQPADLVAIATLGNSLQVNQDFTSNKTALRNTLRGLNPATAAGYAAGATGTTEGTADNGDSFAADDTEFNIANADRSLEAVESICDMLRGVDQKKSLIYFSSGIQRSGVDNEITLRSAVNSCVKSNASIYSVDARGLQANPPGGAADAGSIRGRSAFNGGAQSATLNAQFAQQETISNLATDTGGRAFLASNDFGRVYTQVQRDTRSYYLLGYSSTNHAEDGKYRKIRIVIDRPGARVTARPGYFAPRDIHHMNTASRRQQLDEELNADVADHSLDLYLADAWFRLSPFRYFVPVAITVPGDEVPLHGIDPKAAPEVDVAGEVIDQAGRKLDHVYQTIRLTPEIAGPGQQLRTRNLQYTTGFVLSPGQKYQIRFAVRENQTGQMGAFETVLTIPNVGADETQQPHVLAMSPVLVGSQFRAVRPDAEDPLTASGRALVMSVSHVFSSSQHLYLYFEVYDPKLLKRDRAPGKAHSEDAIKLLTNVAFYHGRVKAFTSQATTTERLTDPRRGAAVIELDVPLSELKPGYYLCQVNAVDPSATRFAFPRVPVLVRPTSDGK
ncbi:MAG: VWA domain-containing protein [Acidobacteria bacterium]|nr:MAG: VWA domain-containing protein [Acidobacteriota bacterium]